MNTLIEDTEFDWDVYLDMAKFILPRLRYFREKNGRWPDRMDPIVWNKKLDAMIRAFEIVLADGVETQQDQQAVDNGLIEFAKHFRELWY